MSQLRPAAESSTALMRLVTRSILILESSFSRNLVEGHNQTPRTYYRTSHTVLDTRYTPVTLLKTPVKPQLQILERLVCANILKNQYCDENDGNDI